MQSSYHILIEESPDIKIMIETENYKIIEANKAARKFFKALWSGKKDRYLVDLLPEEITNKLRKNLTKSSIKNSFKINSLELLNSNSKSLKMNVDVVPVKVKNRKLLECKFTEIKKSHSKENIPDELKITRQKLKSIFDNNPLMIFIIDENGIIKEVNRLGAKELGYKVSELLRKPVTDVFFKEDRKKVKNHILECLKHTGKLFNWEIRKIRKNGEVIWVKESACTIQSNGNNSEVLIVCDNITKIKEAEELESDSAKRIQYVLDAAPLGIHMYELKNNGDLIFSGYNSAAKKILGIDHSELIKNKIEVAFPKLAGTQNPDIYRNIAKKGIRLENEIVEYEDERLSGVFNISAIQIAPGKMATFFTDITEITKTFDKLESSELKFKSLFELANDSIFLMDQEIFIDCNKKTLEIFGCNKEDIIGKPPYDFHPRNNPMGETPKKKHLKK